MNAICSSCQALVLAWIDAFQGFGPITRWRHYSPSQESARVRSAEMHRILVDDRAALIRRQIKAIHESCDHLVVEVSA